MLFDEEQEEGREESGIAGPIDEANKEYRGRKKHGLKIDGGKKQKNTNHSPHSTSTTRLPG